MTQEKMKNAERYAEYIIPKSFEMIVRIDGHKFSKFTKNLNKPFDAVFSYAMEETAKDLLDEYNVRTIYQQSDEITLYFPSMFEEQPKFVHIFGGRTQKIASLIAAFTTIRFNVHFKQKAESLVEQNVVYFNKRCKAYFDARVFGVETKENVIGIFKNRMIDCQRNAKQQFTYTYCSHKELFKKNTDEQVEYCKEKTGKDYNKIHNRYKYGIFVKKELYTKKVDGKDIQRSRIVSFDGKSLKEMNFDIITSKYKGLL